MVNRSEVQQYLASGKQLTVLAGKRPILDNWTSKKISNETIFNHDGNLGWVIGEDDLVIDVDPRNGGDKSFVKLVETLGIKLEPNVFTPSGGFHVYLYIPATKVGIKLKKTLKDFPGIDFLTKGSQCVIVGSSTEVGDYTWSDDLLGGFEQAECHDAILSLLSRRDVGNNSSNNNLGDFEGLIGNSTMPRDTVLEILSKLDSGVSNDEWVRVGMALHHWHPTDGLELWEDWSKDAENYVEGETSKRWRSFVSGGGVTLGTVSHMAREVDYDVADTIVSDLISEINCSTVKDLRLSVCPRIKKMDLPAHDRERMVKPIQQRIKFLEDVLLKITDVRAMVVPSGIRGELVDALEKPEWCNDWVYVNSHAGFMSLKTFNVHKAESFNIENGIKVPFGDRGGKQPANAFVTENGFVEKVDAVAFLPTCKDRFAYIDKCKVLNCFNPHTVPVEAEKFTKEGLASIEVINKHIRFICGNDNDAKFFLQWIAHQVQYPGKKILWAPVIQSIPGVGKSFFGQLLRSMIGTRNVGTVNPMQVSSNFNGWASNVVVNVLEELRVRGHNRYEVVNALKPLITDEMIQINEKGVKPYMTNNTANYICFTNDKDALPMDEVDRRWWVIFVEISSLSEMPKYVGMEADEHFDLLFGGMRAHADEVRKWFLEYDISDSFLSTKQAPMTEHKRSMVTTEESGFEGLSEIRDVIETGGKYITTGCVSQKHLNDIMLFDHPELDLKKGQIRNVMMKLGYSKRSTRIKLDNESLWLWVKAQMDNNKVREAWKFQKQE